MTSLPIVSHYQADPPSRLKTEVNRLAEQLRRECPELGLEDQFRPLVPDVLTDAPTLFLDDLSDIPLLDGGRDVRFMQDRARLRAGDGDFMVTCSPQVPEFESYSRDYLGLGSPHWLHAQPPADPMQIANASWEDRSIRRRLIHEIRAGELLYVHPHMGTFTVWELAALLHQSSRCAVKVIAPPPGVTKWVNDKVAFAETVSRLFGEQFVPRTEHASNFAILAERVKDLATESQTLCLKLPDSAGGGGNIVLDARKYRNKSLRSIRDDLKRVMKRLAWEGTSMVLVGSWESEILSTPSAQLWIPPHQAGMPVVEGLFEQTIEGSEGMFVGSKPARFSQELEREIVDRCWLLASLYQHLGYIGRCSFDMILVGKHFQDCRLEFIECNGRWGGASAPMTLMNRMFGDWISQPYAAGECCVEGLNRITFAELLECVRSDLYDVRTGQGSIIFYNPGRMPIQSGINVLSIANTWEEAAEIIDVTFPQKLQQILIKR